MRHPETCAHALPLSDRLFEASFYVTHAGRERVHPHQAYPRPGHPSCYGYTWEDGRVLGEFCLWLITRGEGHIETVQGRQPIRARQACLYFPGEWHRHRPTPATGWVNYWINFNGSLPHQWLRDGAFRREMHLVPLADVSLFERQFRRLVDAITAAGARNSLQFSWQAIGLLSHFLIDPATASEPAHAAVSGDALVDDVRGYIWSQSHNPIGVSDVAQHLAIHRRTLERRFKSVTGSTLLHEIQRCRLSRAALLLRNTDAPIKYVVGRAGFATYQQLRRAFQQEYGLSPERFRQARERAPTPSLVG